MPCWLLEGRNRRGHYSEVLFTSDLPSANCTPNGEGGRRRIRGRPCCGQRRVCNGDVTGMPRQRPIGSKKKNRQTKENRASSADCRWKHGCQLLQRGGASPRALAQRAARPCAGARAFFQSRSSRPWRRWWRDGARFFGSDGFATEGTGLGANLTQLVVRRAHVVLRPCQPATARRAGKLQVTRDWSSDRGGHVSARGRSAWADLAGRPAGTSGRWVGIKRAASRLRGR